MNLNTIVLVGENNLDILVIFYDNKLILLL